MNVIAMQGYLGAGKTAGAVALAHHLVTKSNGVLYSNIDVKGARPFSHIEDFLKVADDPSSVVLLDEAHVDLDARSFSTNHVKFVSATAFYLRKMRCTLILTSPLFDNLDTRIRGITNLLCLVSKDKTNFYYDMYDIQSDRYLKRMKISQRKLFAADLYDTHAIVTPMEVHDNREGFNKFLAELKQKTLNYYKDRSRAEGA